MLSGPLLVGSGATPEWLKYSPSSTFLASPVLSEEAEGVDAVEGLLVMGKHAASDVTPRESDISAPVMRRR